MAQVNVIGPDEVERRNIITKKEIAATILALRYALEDFNVQVSTVRRHRATLQNALQKLERVLTHFS